MQNAKDIRIIAEVERERSDTQLLSNAFVQFDLQRIDIKIEQTAQNGGFSTSFVFNDDVDTFVIEAVGRLLSNKGYAVNRLHNDKFICNGFDIGW